MKKFVTAIFAMLIVATSCVAVSAAVSPQATVVPDQKPTSSTVVVDNSSKSPQTGSNDVLPYAVMGLSVLACGTAAVMLAKTKESK